MQPSYTRCTVLTWVYLLHDMQNPRKFALIVNPVSSEWFSRSSLRNETLNNEQWQTLVLLGDDVRNRWQSLNRYTPTLFVFNDSLGDFETINQKSKYNVITHNWAYNKSRGSLWEWLYAACAFHVTTAWLSNSKRYRNLPGKFNTFALASSAVHSFLPQPRTVSHHAF